MGWGIGVESEAWERGTHRPVPGGSEVSWRLGPWSGVKLQPVVIFIKDIMFLGYSGSLRLVALEG